VRPVAHLHPLTDAATCVALSVVLGSMRLLELPFGGSVSLAPLPILLLALVHGGRRAAVAGCIAGMAHAMLGGTIVHPVQLVLDYGLAYAVLGLAGPFGGGSQRRAAVGVVVATAARYACLVLSGVVFFGRYAGSHAVLAYSLAYNAAYTMPELLLCLALLPTMSRAWHRATGGAPAAAAGAPLPRVAPPAPIVVTPGSPARPAPVRVEPAPPPTVAVRPPMPSTPVTFVRRAPFAPAASGGWPGPQPATRRADS
jgi:thiamine transporter